MDGIAQIVGIATGLCLGTSLLRAGAVQAEASPATTQAATVQADSQPDSRPARTMRAAGVSLYWENDGTFVRPNWATDRHYTSGTGIAVQWQNDATDEIIGQIPSIYDEFAPQTPGTSFGAGVVCSMNMYTPTDLSDPNPIPDDRPYAGWSYAGFIAQRANRAETIPVFEHIELDLGTIGASGQAGKVQTWVHDQYGAEKPEGWDNQIRDEVGIDLRYQRRWRMDLMGEQGDRGVGVQLIPEAGFTVGTTDINAATGALIRAGWNMPDDFGPGRMRYASDFTRSFANLSNAPSGYLFMRVAGALVAHDSTIDGSFFRNSPVEGASETCIGEWQAGVALQFFKYFQVVYSQTYTSHEFVGQKHIDAYGALNLTAIYTW